MLCLPANTKDDKLLPEPSPNLNASPVLLVEFLLLTENAINVISASPACRQRVFPSALQQASRTSTELLNQAHAIRSQSSRLPSNAPSSREPCTSRFGSFPTAAE